MSKPKDNNSQPPLDKGIPDLDEPPPEYWEYEPPEPLRDDEIAAASIEQWLQVPSLTQTRLAELFRGRDDAVAGLVAKMLDPRGYAGWKLELKRSRRGAPADYAAALVEHFYDEAVAEGGERGAVKRVAQDLKMSPEAVRSAIRRATGTHGPRREKRGRK
jgi:hypothetical protein